MSVVLKGKIRNYPFCSCFKSVNKIRLDFFKYATLKKLCYDWYSVVHYKEYRTFQSESRTHHMIKNILTKIIKTQPDVIQFVKDRKYEEAWIITLRQDSPDNKEIVAYLNKKTFKTIIVEYIWNSQDDDDRFVLTIFLDESCTLKNPRKFIDISLELFYNYKDFENLINSFDEKVIGHRYLLTNPVESINMSVFNYWLSENPVELWQLGDKVNFDEIKMRIKSRANVYKTKLNYQGLLFRFNTSGKYNGPYYGIKTPCCNKIGKEWVVDFNKVEYWINLVLND